MGNLLTDAYAYGFQNSTCREKCLLNSIRRPMAVLSAGCIRGTISAKNVTLADILSVIPFGNTMRLVTVSGAQIWSMFEHSVHRYCPSKYCGPGEFLQISRARVVYDVNQPAGHRVVSVKVNCGSSCEEDVQMDRDYDIVMSEYMLNGGDGFDMFQSSFAVHRHKATDLNLVIKYFKKFSPINIGTENRIHFINANL